MLKQQNKYHEELKLELQGAEFSAVRSEEGEDAEGVAALPDLKQMAEDAANMEGVLLSRKTKGLLTAMEVRMLITYVSCALDLIQQNGAVISLLLCCFRLAKRGNRIVQAF